MPCLPIDPVCNLGEKIGGEARDAVIGSALDKLAAAVAEAVERSLETLATFWMKVPSPTGLGLGNTIVSMHEWLSVITAGAAMMGIFIAMGYMAWSGQLGHGAEAAKMLVRLVIVSGAGVAGVGILIASGDAFSPWIIEQATGEPFSGQARAMITKNVLGPNGPGVTIFVGILLFLAAAMQVIFMIVRSALLVVMMVVWPTVAATTATEEGRAWFKRLNGWILAWVLYKPVAAIIYATGFKVVKEPVVVAGASPETNAMMALLMGSTVIILAALSLPALIKLVAPIAGVGSSSMFSGAVAAGAIATGAAAVAGLGPSAGAIGATGAARTMAPPPSPPPTTESATGSTGTSEGGHGPGGGGPTGDGGQGPTGTAEAPGADGADSKNADSQRGADPGQGDGPGSAEQEALRPTVVRSNTAADVGPHTTSSSATTGTGAAQRVGDGVRGAATVADRAADDMSGEDQPPDRPSGPTGA